MKELYFTKTFARDYRKLPPNIQSAVDKQLEFLLSNPRHSSLNVKKMQDPREIWELRVTDSYRLTFQAADNIYVLRKVGTHKILKKP